MIKIRNAPIEIKIYAIFSFFVTIIFASIPFLFKEISKEIVPYVGWVPFMPYMNILTIFFPNNKEITYKKIRNSSIWFLIIYIIYGLIGIFFLDNKITDNPYLEVSKYRFIWVVLVPIFWICVLKVAPFWRQKSIGVE